MTMRLAVAAKTVLVEATGWLLLLGGLAAIPLPGPGLLITFAGLLLLSRRYAWAERRVGLVRLRALHAAATSVATGPRLAASVCGAALAAAAGVAWITLPSAPLWWPLAERWWLPGGSVVGVTQLISAAVALALLGYGYRRFQRQPEPASSIGRAIACADETAPTARCGAPVAVVRKPVRDMRRSSELLSGCLCATGDAHDRSTCATRMELR